MRARVREGSTRGCTLCLCRALTHHTSFSTCVIPSQLTPPTTYLASSHPSVVRRVRPIRGRASPPQRRHGRHRRTRDDLHHQPARDGAGGDRRGGEEHAQNRAVAVRAEGGVAARRQARRGAHPDALQRLRRGRGRGRARVPPPWFGARPRGHRRGCRCGCGCGCGCGCCGCGCGCVCGCGCGDGSCGAFVRAEQSKRGGRVV
jgi:hypothetical protein